MIVGWKCFSSFASQHSLVCPLADSDSLSLSLFLSYKFPLSFFRSLSKQTQTTSKVKQDTGTECCLSLCQAVSFLPTPEDDEELMMRKEERQTRGAKIKECSYWHFLKLHLNEH